MEVALKNLAVLNNILHKCLVSVSKCLVVVSKCLVSVSKCLVSV